MSLDELVLRAQRAIDRAVRRTRRGAPPAAAERRLLIVQIDGLARAVLEHGLDTGRAPFLRRLLHGGGWCMDPMSVSLPTSTPAFQMAAFYGVRPDIPGFHYYSRERQGDIHFPRSGHAAWVEAQQAAGRRGILQGGSAYGCCFTGGADNNLFTFASLTKPSGRGVLSVLSPFVVVAWVAAKNIALTIVELASKDCAGFVRTPARETRLALAGPEAPDVDLGAQLLHDGGVTRPLRGRGCDLRQLPRLRRDGARVRPAQRPAHAGAARSGPALEQLWRVMRRVPEHRYDAYILADHGQSPCTPYAN